MPLRAMGPFNGTLPVPTGMVQGFMRDPKKMPYLKYTQLIPAPEILFMYAKLDPDEAVRLVNLNEFTWAYDDYRPTGKAWQPRVEWLSNSTDRWDFPYTIGNATKRIWSKNGIDPQALFDRLRANHAALHRAVRVVNAMTGASWGANTTPLNTLLGTSGAGWDKSSGQEKLVDGTTNPNFQIIRRSLMAIKRRMHLATNAALTGEELICVIPPAVAIAIAQSGEMVEFLKGSPFAKDLTDWNVVNWGLPPTYGGFTFVVEDTPRCFINQKEDGTVADVTVASEKDYILSADTVFFASRPGGIDGGYGYQNFSTIQCYHFNGEARVEAFSEPKHDLVEGHIVMEDKIIAASTASGFALTDVLVA